MEDNERNRIRAVTKTNHELKRLYDEHVGLEEQLARLENRPYLTKEEEIEEKLLKKRKLVGVDKMMAIIAQGESAEAM